VKVVARIALILLTAAVLEAGVLTQVRIAGAEIDVLLLCAVAAGFAGGPDAGALVGFFAGLLLDLLLPAPLGLAALSYCLAGYATGTMRGTSVRTSRWQTSALVATGSAIGVGAYVAGAAVLGHSGLLRLHLLTVMVVVCLVNALLAPLAVRLMRWALGDAAIQRTALR
jgi:rod shape-determining protein MreD